jgi:hypothetical protein
LPDRRFIQKASLASGTKALAAEPLAPAPKKSGHGGKREGAKGRPRTLSDWDEITVGQECEKRLDAIAQRNAWATIEGQPHSEELRVLQAASREILATERSPKIRQRRLKAVHDDIERILPRRRRCRVVGCPSPIAGCGKFECSRRLVSVELKRPQGCVAEVENAVARKWGITPAARSDPLGQVARAPPQAS